MTTGHKRLDIQGLRAFAVTAVVAYHAGVGVSSGFIGVDVFFAISGFVITSSLVRELERTSRIGFANFYVRRIKRLLPALAVMLLFVAAVGSLLDPVAATRMTGLTGVAASGFGANVYLAQLPTGYFGTDMQLNPLLHTWTLAVEEQFYLLFPLLLLFGWRSTADRRTLSNARASAALVLGAALAASYLLAYESSHHWTHFGYYAAPARAWEFAAGSLIALAVPLARRMPQHVALVLATIALFALVLTVIGPPTGATLWLETAAVGATCGLLLAGARDSNGITSALSARPLVRVGDLSYSWYLWHWPLIVFARALLPTIHWAGAIGAVVSLVPAWLSFRYIENPVRSNTRLRGARVAVLAAACIALPALASAASAGVRLAHEHVLPAAMHADFTRGCDSPKPFGSSYRLRCTWNVPNARGTIVLLGDSNAGHFTEPVAAAARRAGFDLDVATLSSCPFLPLRITVQDQLERDCMSFVARSMPALLRAKPSLIILGDRWDSWLVHSSNGLGVLRGTSVSTDPKAKQRLLTVALRGELTTFNRAGIPVVVVHPIPQLGVETSSCAVVIVLFGGCTGTRSRQSADASLHSTLVAERSAIRGRRTSFLLDLENQICSATRCTTFRHGIAMYRNANHLSIEGALTLTPLFYETIVDHARRSRAAPDTNRTTEISRRITRGRPRPEAAVRPVSP